MFIHILFRSYGAWIVVGAVAINILLLRSLTRLAELRVEEKRAVGLIQPPLETMNTASSGLLTKSLPVLERGDERLDHFSVDIVTIELIQLVQPKVIAAQVCIR